MTILSDAVGLVNSVTSALGVQATVRLGKYLSDDGAGDPEWKYTTHSVVLQYKSQMVLTSDGREVVSGHSVTFLNPRVVVNEGDQITYKNVTDVVKSVSSPVDSTGRLLTQAFL